MVRSSYDVQRLTAPSMDTNLSPDELAAWEDADSMILPPLEDRDAADPESVELEQAKERQNPYARVAEAYKRKAEYEASRPKLGDHKPNKWQRLAAAAANFGAGYVNMGGRTRVDSGALNTLNDSLLRPGYTRAMQDWKDQGAGVDAEVEGTRAQAQIDMASQRAETDRQRAEAYARSQEAIAAERMARMNKPPSRYINTAKGAFDTETGKYVEAPKDPGRPFETKEQEWARLHKEATEGLGYKIGSPEYRAHMGDKAALEEIKSEFRPARGRRGGGGGNEERRGTPGQFDDVQEDADREYAKAEEEALKKLEDSIPGWDKNNPWKYKNEADKKTVLDIQAWLTDRKNEIAEKYARRVKQYGGEAEAVRYGGGSKKQAIKTTEKDVVDWANKNGVDPAKAIAAAKQRGAL